MDLVGFVVYVAAFVTIWFGAGLIVSAVDNFSKRLKLSTFAVSFVILGILTSTPEFGVGLTAISKGTPDVFVGNLLGGVFVIFLLVIPLLAVLGGKVKLNNTLDKSVLVTTLIVIMAPATVLLDGVLAVRESVVLVIMYLGLVILVERKQGLLGQGVGRSQKAKVYSYKDLLKILVGIGVVLLSSQVIVAKTVVIASAVGLPLLFVSLILLSVGTNLPELSLALRSVVEGKKDVAFGDYMGSAAVNTLFMGIFGLMTGRVVLEGHFWIIGVFMLGGLGGFYKFIRSKNELSRREGAVLLVGYVLFCIWELFLA